MSVSESVAKTTPGVLYLDGPRLSRALRAGIANVLIDQEHLNKINVYPVADGDTGTNLALTLRSILPLTVTTPEPHAGQFLIRVADAAIDGARGNSGALVAQFLQGVADHSVLTEKIYAADLATACSNGARCARDAMSEPVEGTILTVLDDFCRSLSASVGAGANDLETLLMTGLADAQKSLENTPNLLDTLRKAGVVDAGAAGFVDLLSGIDELLRTGVDPDLSAVELDDPGHDELAAGTAADLQYRYCTECLISGEMIDRRKLREQITSLGNSMVIVGSHAKTRVHIHTNKPDDIYAVAARFGSISAQKADDMQNQQKLVHAQQHQVVIATDTGGDIPDSEVERLNIYQTPIWVHFGNESYLDKVSISADQFYRKLRNESLSATTSQPAPGDFRRQYQFLASHYKEVISVNLSAKLSGTFQAAQSAAANSDAGSRVQLVDSKNASLGQGLLVIDAAEAAQAGLSGELLITRIEEMIPRSFTFGVLPDLGYGVRGGRVSPWLKRVADLLHLVPVLGNTPNGEIKPIGVLWGRRNLVGKFARFVSRRVTADRTYRLAVAHADCEQDGRDLLAALEKVIPNRHQTLFTRLGTGLGVHAGPQGMVVGIQDYTPPDAPV